MIHVSWYVSWNKKSIKYQVSWYIFGTVSVSVTMIHFGWISIINHWYMTVIHLLAFRTLYWQRLQLVDSSSWVSTTVTVSRQTNLGFLGFSPIPCSLQTYREVVKLKTIFFDYGTIPSTDSAVGAVDRECTSTTWVTLSHFNFWLSLSLRLSLS